jgi:hypothetical protein
MPNFLEQLVAEWYEFQGYFVRRNVKVGKRPNGGYDSELDVVAFNPNKLHLVHIEPSMDCYSWSKREERFAAKFKAGKKYIPSLFSSFSNIPEIDQRVILVYGRNNNYSEIGGGRLVFIKDLMTEIRIHPEWGLAARSVSNRAVPEQYTILRSLQFSANYWPLRSNISDAPSLPMS